jgi:hypothetical protein
MSRCIYSDVLSFEAIRSYAPFSYWYSIVHGACGNIRHKISNPTTHYVGIDTQSLLPLEYFDKILFFLELSQKFHESSTLYTVDMIHHELVEIRRERDLTRTEFRSMVQVWQGLVDKRESYIVNEQTDGYGDYEGEEIGLEKELNAQSEHLDRFYHPQMYDERGELTSSLLNGSHEDVILATTTSSIISGGTISSINGTGKESEKDVDMESESQRQVELWLSGGVPLDSSPIDYSLGVVQ